MILPFRKKMLLIFNPKSGVQKFPSHLFDVVDRFTSAGFFVTVYPTQAAGEVGEIVSLHGAEFDYLVCSGGDGTISEAIDAMMPLTKRPAFGIIPSGTVNDFAGSLNIPRDALQAADIIIEASPSALDVGMFGDKHFSYVAAFGAFTDVSYSTPQNAKNLFGKLAYFVEGLKRVGQIKTLSCEILLDDERVEGDFALGIVANAYSIAGYKLPAELDVKLDDGFFEVVLIQRPHSLKDSQEIISLLLAHEIKTDLVIIRKAKKIAFTSSEPVAWTLDGDFGGEYSGVIIENQKHAVEILVPM